MLYIPVENASRADLDYSTLINYWVQSPDMGLKYLEGTSLSDVFAYRHFAQRGDWNNALFYARRALREGANERESRLMSVYALRVLGKPHEALDLLNKGNDRSYEARLLEVDVLFDLGRFQEARQQIRQMLPEAPPELRVKLESMIRQVDARICVK